MEKDRYVLGIETSCDDTSLCILRGTPGIWESSPEILFHQSYGQDEILAPYGGVVPEIAARNHLKKMTPLIKDAMKKSQLALSDIDLLAVTTHPGLMGPLLTGICGAKTLSLMSELPIVPINHLFAHLEAIHLESAISYPYIGLLVSGGHTMNVLVKGQFEFEIISSTIDDAAGEAFDKGGKLLGLGYPAGRIIDQIAVYGDDRKFSFPIGLKNKNRINLSFSGVKTSLRYAIDALETKLLVKRDPSTKKLLSAQEQPQLLKDICASYQKAIVDALIYKLKQALECHPTLAQNIVVGGGVASNGLLRKSLVENFSGVHIVPPKYCTDNAAMVAGLGLRQYEKQIAFPECLEIDGFSKFIKKSDFSGKTSKAK
ncbi:MAG: tRNA (adenosine(37)-N6)-threonylcarbamoyltransferase complex transferase subunit TsaD [Bacteriovoracaceae bacterium]|jgi:N6-L-threonylcarbamoyladenine synthase|nr:tRNA (adenosine(37)-N6)-threonylcarbamoyltransferase complex transferase subunit TsaD [Bacteriovoracaceae bacterium]